MPKSASPPPKSRNSTPESSLKDANVTEELYFNDYEKSTKIYSRVLGPTADETILAGLQTVLDMCSSTKKDVDGKPYHNKSITQWFNKDYSALHKDITSYPSPVSLNNIVERKQTLQEIKQLVENKEELELNSRRMKYYERPNTRDPIVPDYESDILNEEETFSGPYHSTDSMHPPTNPSVSHLAQLSIVDEPITTHETTISRRPSTISKSFTTDTDDYPIQTSNRSSAPSSEFGQTEQTITTGHTSQSRFSRSYPSSSKLSHTFAKTPTNSFSSTSLSGLPCSLYTSTNSKLKFTNIAYSNLTSTTPSTCSRKLNVQETTNSRQSGKTKDSFDSFKMRQSNQPSVTSLEMSLGKSIHSYVKPSQVFRHSNGSGELCNSSYSRKASKAFRQNSSPTTSKSTSPITTTVELSFTSLGTSEMSSTCQSVRFKKKSKLLDNVPSTKKSSGLLNTSSRKKTTRSWNKRNQEPKHPSYSIKRNGYKNTKPASVTNLSTITRVSSTSIISSQSACYFNRASEKKPRRLRKRQKSNDSLKKQMKTYQSNHLTTKLLRKFDMWQISHQMQGSQSHSQTHDISIQADSMEASKSSSTISQTNFNGEGEDSYQSEDESQSSQKYITSHQPHYLKSRSTKSTSTLSSTNFDRNKQQIKRSQKYSGPHRRPYKPYERYERSPKIRRRKEKHNAISVSTISEHNKRSPLSRRLHRPRHRQTSIFSQTAGKFIRDSFSHKQHSLTSKTSLHRSSNHFRKSNDHPIKARSCSKSEKQAFENEIQTSLSYPPDVMPSEQSKKSTYLSTKSDLKKLVAPPQAFVSMVLNTFRTGTNLPEEVPRHRELSNLRHRSRSKARSYIEHYQADQSVYPLRTYERTRPLKETSTTLQWMNQNLPLEKSNKSNPVSRARPPSIRSTGKSAETQSVYSNRKQSASSEKSDKLIQVTLLDKKVSSKRPLKLSSKLNIPTLKSEKTHKSIQAHPPNGKSSKIAKQLTVLTSRSHIAFLNSSPTQTPPHKSMQISEATALQCVGEKSRNSSISSRKLLHTSEVSHTPPQSHHSRHSISSKSKSMHVSRTCNKSKELTPRQSGTSMLSHKSRYGPQINILIRSPDRSYSSRHPSRSVDSSMLQSRTSLLSAKSEVYIDIDAQEMDNSHKARSLSPQQKLKHRILKEKESESDNINLEHLSKKTLNSKMSAKSCQMKNPNSNKSLKRSPGQTSKSIQTFVASSDKSLEIAQSIKSVHTVSKMKNKSCQHLNPRELIQAFDGPSNKIWRKQSKTVSELEVEEKSHMYVSPINSQKIMARKMKPATAVLNRHIQSTNSHAISKTSINSIQSNSSTSSSQQQSVKNVETMEMQYNTYPQCLDPRENSSKLRQTSIYGNCPQMNDSESRPRHQRSKSNKTVQIPIHCRGSAQTLRQQTEREILPEESSRYSNRSLPHSSKQIQFKPLKHPHTLRHESNKMLETPERSFQCDSKELIPHAQEITSDIQSNKSMQYLEGSEAAVKFIQTQNWHDTKSLQPPAPERSFQSLNYQSNKLQSSAKPNLYITSLQTLRDQFNKSHEHSFVIPEPSLKIQNHNKSRRQKCIRPCQLTTSEAMSTPSELGNGTHELSEGNNLNEPFGKLVYNIERAGLNSAESFTSSFTSEVMDEPSIGHSHFVNAIDEESRKSWPLPPIPETSKEMEGYNVPTGMVSILASVNRLESSHERPYGKTSISASVDKPNTRKSKKCCSDNGDISSSSKLPNTENEEQNKISEETFRTHQSSSLHISDARSQGIQTTSLQGFYDRSQEYQTASFAGSIARSLPFQTNSSNIFSDNSHSYNIPVSSSSFSKSTNNIEPEPSQRSGYMVTDDKSHIFPETHDANSSLYTIGAGKESNLSSLQDSSYCANSTQSPITNNSVTSSFQDRTRPLQGNYTSDHSSASYQTYLDNSQGFSQEMVPNNSYQWNFPENSPPVRSHPDVSHNQDHELSEPEKEQIISKKLNKSNSKNNEDNSRGDLSIKPRLIEDENASTKSISSKSNEEPPQPRRGPLSPQQSKILSLETVQEESTEELPVHQKASKALSESPSVATKVPSTCDVQRDDQKRSLKASESKQKKEKDKDKKEKKDKEKTKKQLKDKESKEKKSKKGDKSIETSVEKDTCKMIKKNTSSHSRSETPEDSSLKQSSSVGEIRYATVRISKYNEFCTFEILNSVKKNPKRSKPVNFENIFVVKNNDK